MKRRELLQSTGWGAASLLLGLRPARANASRRRPNVIFVFADQWRAHATGYAGDQNVRTPHLDRLASESVNLTNAV